MKERIFELYRDYIRDHHPDLLATLLEEQRAITFFTEQVASVEDLIIVLTGKEQPRSVIEEECLRRLMTSLGPSRYDYLHSILDEEFPKHFEKYYEQGILHTELINLVRSCQPVFEELQFSQSAIEDRYMRYAIIGAVHEYLESSGGL